LKRSSVYVEKSSQILIKEPSKSVKVDTSYSDDSEKKKLKNAHGSSSNCM
jgi:hypothetical protein